MAGFVATGLPAGVAAEVALKAPGVTEAAVDGWFSGGLLATAGFLQAARDNAKSNGITANRVRIN